MSTHKLTHAHTHVQSTDLASRNLERRIMTASQVLCLSCIWMELNLRWMIPTMRSISLGEMGRVRDCSLSRFITWVVNSLHACQKGRETKTSRVSALKVTTTCGTSLTDMSRVLFTLEMSSSDELGKRYRGDIKGEVIAER